MPAIIVVFPPASGGNHLRNVVASCYVDSDQLVKLYKKFKPTVHQKIGGNLQLQAVEEAVANQDQTHILHGHFGEIISFQNQIRSITDKKFIILSPDSTEDRMLLSTRRQILKHESFPDKGYFDQEQVFLYEPFMYYWYFQTPMDHIMNISISDWFTKEIDSVLDKLSYFLKLPINKETTNVNHATWIEANKL